VARAEAAGDRDEQEILNRLLSDFFDPRQTVLLEGGDLPALENGDPARLPRAALVAEQPERLTVELRGASGPGYLVVLDSYAPGWRAEVDGVPAGVQLADFAFRAVPFPAGAREIILTYEPASVRRGALISAGALLAVLIALAIGLARSRLAPPRLDA
jgi:hypothetical protein